MYRLIPFALAAAMMPAFALQGQDADPTKAMLKAPMSTVGKGVDTPDAAQFAQQASMTNMFEIEAARLATVRAAKPDTSAFAQQVLNDQLKAQADLRVAAGEEGVKLATSLDRPHRNRLKALEDADDDKFDETFYTTQLDVQKNALQLLAAYGSRGEREALRAFAQAHFSTRKITLARAQAVATPE